MGKRGFPLSAAVPGNLAGFMHGKEHDGARAQFSLLDCWANQCLVAFVTA